MSKRPRIDARTSLEDLAALVCSTLEAHGISVVLSGGAVVSIYSDAEYVSDDRAPGEHDRDTVGLERGADEGGEIFEGSVLVDPKFPAHSGLPARRGRRRSVK